MDLEFIKMKTFSYTAHSKQVLGDMHTPVSIYLKVRDMYPQSALMESSDYHAAVSYTHLTLPTKLEV